MAGDLIISAPGLPGLVDEKEIDGLAAAFYSRIDPDGRRDEISGPGARLPSTSERHLFSDRLQQVSLALRPVSSTMADKENLARELGQFFLGYPSLRNANASEMVTAYVLDLQDLPLFAIKAALQDIKHGRVYDIDSRTQRRIPLSPDFPPATPRIIAQAQKCAGPTYALRTTLQTVLRLDRVAPPPLPEEKQQEISRGLKQVAADLSMLTAIDEQKEIERRARAREQLEAGSERMVRREFDRRGLVPPPGPIVASPFLIDKIKRDTEAAAKVRSETADADAEREAYMEGHRAKYGTKAVAKKKTTRQ